MSRMRTSGFCRQPLSRGEGFGVTRKPGHKSRAISQCGQWDNYRTIFEDFKEVYLLGLQINS